MADVDIMMSQWQNRGGTVMQSTASNGRILRTFIAPSGEKFRSWKECLKYMEDNTDCQNDEPATRKKRLSSGKDAKGSNGSLKKNAKRNSDEKQNNEIVIVDEDSKGSHGSSKKKAKRNSDETQNNEIVIVEEDADLNNKEDDLANGRKQPKRAAACSNFKEKTYAFSVKNSIIETKAEKVVDGEDVAIVLTSEGGDDETPQRRLVDFIVHDDQGRSQPIETVDIMPLYITGTVVPMKGPLDKQKGVRCEGFGPLQSWSVTGYEESSPTVWICTDTAEYACSKPAGAYKKSFSHIFDKAVVCVEVYRALSKPDGGDPQLSLNDVFARISRSLLGGKSSLSQYFTRDYFYSIGKFVNEQLKALDVNADENEQIFSGLPALDALEDECAKRTSSAINQAHAASRNGTLTIRDNGLVDASGSSLTSNDTNAVTDDEKLARLLQQQEEMSFGNAQARRGRGMPKSKVYIKINEDEIANDYPLPAYYKADEEETDEYVLFDDEAIALDPADLPRRKLTDWALYNSDSRLVSLELLPMLPGAETDMEIFGSGIMTEDDGSGFCLDSNVEDSNEVNGSGSNPQDPQGIRIYLSAIKEWMIEFGASMLFISIRTDGAWYRLGKPSPQYIPWYNPVLKTAKLAIRVITMLKDASRVSRLSFADVIKKLTDQEKDEGTFISSKTPDVERYVVVHGQIILQQFAEYPDETVRRSAFVNGLTQKMEQKHHTKLTIVKKKIVIKKGKNLNPRANLRPDGTKAKPMRATTTKLIHRIWSEYYAKSSPNGEVGDQNEVDNEVKEIEEDVDENEENEDVTDAPTISKTSRSKTGKIRTTVQSVKWVGKSLGKTASGDSLYSKATFRGEEIVVGGTVSAVLDDDDSALPVILLIEYLYQKNGSYMLHGRILERGCLTVLGNAADNREVYLMDNCEDISIDCIKETVVVNFRKRPWGHEHRKADSIEDEEHRIKAEEREKKGLSTVYFCRAVYCPDKGAFFGLSSRTMGLGTGICNGCQIREGADAKSKTNIFSNNDGICLEGVDYLITDFLYLDPSTFEPLDDDNDQKEKFKGGRSKGLRAFVVCQLMSVKSTSNGKRNDTFQLTVRRFYRPEDIGPLKAYKADAREVYYSEDTVTVSSNSVRGRCEVWRHQDALLNLESNALRHVFYCSCIFDPKKGTVKQLPAAIKLGSSRLPSASKGKSKSDEVVAKGKGKVIVDEVVAKVKGKGKMIEDDQQQNSSDTNKESRLATLDIFAGCGGLSEGLHQSGVSNTRWAIEYEHPAAEAFKLNHPTSEVFCENCNVILRCIMEKGGDLDDCLSTPEAADLCLKLDDDKKNRLPKPGEVDFINGGPPCQGFSGMNRFNQRAWSKVQCEMILAFLSYADYFRPRYFLLENVRNFISFNKGQTFRLTLASLLAMGYQVRFGILQAGNYGVSQSRTRAFIWAASPMDKLPEWPEPMHVFAGSQLKIPLSIGLYYAAVKDASQGAPFRSITVRDTIADLPPVGNGATEVERSYGNDPESWFQKQIRGQERVLYDHISKEMNELNLIRCQRIPKRPGADWRDLPEEKVKLSTGQVVDLIPWCLPNTADRHNQWKGLFGRLDWDGNFPTSVTDPQPMGKVGMCFHPEQDRIVTVRECARSQGFPDGYKFYGNIQSKHRQIGNAVPPPLARALGEKLKEVIQQEEPCE